MSALGRTPRYFALWDDERRARYLVALVEAGRWGAYFELSGKRGGRISDYAQSRKDRR